MGAFMAVEVDWVETLDYFGVEYVEHGPNVAQNNINVQCPWCGGADTSHHLGISLNGKGWGCWRDSGHRGKSPVKLLAALTHRPWRDIEKILGEAEIIERTALDEILEALENPKTKTKAPAAEAVEVPSTLRRLTRKVADKQFFDYLARRGFSKPRTVAKKYGLMRDTSTEWYGRVIMPVQKDRKIIGWTARAMAKAHLRYKAHPPGPAVSSALYGTEWCPGGETLFLVEGPFDAIKLDWILRGTESNAVASMSTALSAGRRRHLVQTLSRYENLCVLFDQGADGHAMDVLDNVRHATKAAMFCLPSDIDDPGDLPESAGLRIIKLQMMEYGCVRKL